MNIEDLYAEEEFEDPTQLTRRGLLVKSGLAAAGVTMLGAPAAAFAGTARTDAITKVAVVTHGDTGSFWSVFKKGVDQAAKDLKGRGITVTQVYANNNVSKQVSGINAAIAGGAKVIATSVPDASALKDPLAKAAAKGIVIITVNSGLGAFDDLATYEVHVGQTEDIAGQGAGKQFKKAGAKKVLIVIHEASNSGLQQRADGVKKILGGSAVKVLTIPNAKSDIPGTKAKVKAAFTADRSLDGLPRSRPRRDDPVHRCRQGRDEGRHVRRRRLDQADPGREDDVRDRPAAVPAGVPAGGVRDALRDQPEHCRQRRTRADRARDHQQGERGPRRRARREGDPLGADAGSASRGSSKTAASIADPDERLVRVGPLARILTRPDIGAFLGAVAVFLAFAYFARSVNWIGDPAIAAGWTDQAAQYGIVAVPVALLMIGGEFDLSAGAMIGSSGLLLGYLTTFQDLNIWPAMAIVHPASGLRSASSTASSCLDEPAEFHRHAGDVLRPPGCQRCAAR